jgi:hypothetical protein
VVAAARALTRETLGAWLVPLEEPLLRAELLGRPDLSSLEVLRMPAGSNPSFVTPAQLAVLASMNEELAQPV